MWSCHASTLPGAAADATYPIICLEGVGDARIQPATIPEAIAGGRSDAAACLLAPRVRTLPCHAGPARSTRASGSNHPLPHLRPCRRPCRTGHVPRPDRRLETHRHRQDRHDQDQPDRTRVLGLHGTPRGRDLHDALRNRVPSGGVAVRRRRAARPVRRVHRPSDTARGDARQRRLGSARARRARRGRVPRTRATGAPSTRMPMCASPQGGCSTGST